MITGIHHISMKCGTEDELSKAKAFYLGTLGFTVEREWPDGIMINAGNCMLEIFSNDPGIRTKGAIRHIAFSTDDVDSIIRRVKEAGYEVFIEPNDIVIRSEPEYPARMAFCFGPLGEEIEFFQEKDILDRESHAVAGIMGTGNMITVVDSNNLQDAAVIHSVSWQASHRDFCSTEFIEIHTPEHQQAYLLEKINQGSRIFMLTKDKPVGIVSVTGSLIEDLYVLPDYQNQGYGTQLLHYAIEQCAGAPVLWILENNKDAERLYRREGFTETGNRQAVTDGLDEIEFILKERI